MDNAKKRERGSALLVVLFVSTAVALIVAGFIRMVNVEMKNADKSFYRNSCLNIAESGAEEAVWALNNDDFTGWMTSPNDAWIGLTNFNMGNNVLASARVLVQNRNSVPTIITEGRVLLSDGTLMKKQIRITLAERSVFSNGLTSKDTLIFSGGNAEVDAYDSSLASLVGNRIDHGFVATTSALTDALAISNATIFGYLATGGSAPDIGPNGKVYGADRQWEVEVVNDSSFFVDSSRITQDFSSNFDDVTIPALTTASYPSGNHVTIGDSTGATTEVYHASSINIRNNRSLTIEGPVILIVDGDVSVKGTMTIVDGTGSLDLYLGGDMDVGGNGIVNLPPGATTPPKPEKMMIYGTATSAGAQTIKLAGNGILAASVYAPNASVELKGGGSAGEMYGAVVANNIKITGNYAFHYDVNLQDTEASDSWKMSDWSELITAAERIDLESYFP